MSILKSDRKVTRKNTEQSLIYLHIEAKQNKVICLECKRTITVETDKTHTADTHTEPQITETTTEKTSFYDPMDLHTPIGRIDKKRIILFVAIVLAATVIYAILNPTSCSVEAELYLSKVRPTIQEWDSALEIANITPRIAIYQSVAQLDAIKRKVQNIEPHPCVREAHMDLLDYMTNTINMFTAFASDSQYMMSLYKDRADSSLTSFFEKLSKNRQ